MTVPFREEETSALARAEQLEAENEELRKEIQALRDSMGENRDAYVTNIENQLKAAKSELAAIKGEREWKPTRPPTTISMTARERYVTQGAVTVLAVILLGLWALFRK